MARTVTKTVSKRGTKTAATPPPKDIRKRLKQLVEETERNWFEFAQLAAEAYDTEMYKAWGYTDFMTYCQQELGFTSSSSYRMAMWRVQMGRTIKELGLKEGQVAKLGWTKFKELSGLLNKDMTSDEVKDMLLQAQGMSFREVQDYVKKTRLSTEGREATTFRTFTFKNVPNDQGALIDQAIRDAMELIGTQDPTAAFEYICTEWMLKHKGKASPDILEKIKLMDEKEKKPTRVKHKEKAKPKKAKAEVLDEEEVPDLIL